MQVLVLRDAGWETVPLGLTCDTLLPSESPPVVRGPLSYLIRKLPNTSSNFTRILNTFYSITNAYGTGGRR